MTQSIENEALLTQDRVRELFEYNSETGILTNRIKRSAQAVIGKEAGYLRPDGYRLIGINKILYYAHRLIWLYVHGEFPSDHIDHIDGNPANNRLGNLRVVTHGENGKNKKQYDNNKSGITGVHLLKGKYWTANIAVKGKKIHLYCGEDFFGACCARKSAEIKYKFHENHGRIV